MKNEFLQKRLAVNSLLVLIFGLVIGAASGVRDYGDVRKEATRLPGRSLLGATLSFAVGNTTLVYDPGEAECNNLNTLKDNQDKCVFVTSIDSCHVEGLIDYLKFIYCQVPSKLFPLAIILLCLWLLYLFIILGATAQEFFCPSLQIISETLKLSQNVAGVTLLAFGNGAPDIFSAITVIKQPDEKKASLAIGALFGAGMFVGSVVIGTIAITRPFKLTERPFLRDILFYLIAVFWVFTILWQNKVTIYSAVGFVIMYCVYVNLVIFGRLTFQNWRKCQRNKASRQAVQNESQGGVPLEVLQGPLPPPTTTATVAESEYITVTLAQSTHTQTTPMQTSGDYESVPLNNPPISDSDEGLSQFDQLESSLEQRRLLVEPAMEDMPAETLLDGTPHLVTESSHHILLTMPEPSDVPVVAIPRPLFASVLEHLWPSGLNLRNLNVAGRVTDIMKNPAGFLFTFTLPVVDADEEEAEMVGEEWNMWLHILRVITLLGFFVSVARSSKRSLTANCSNDVPLPVPSTSVLMSEEDCDQPESGSLECTESFKPMAASHDLVTTSSDDSDYCKDQHSNDDFCCSKNQSQHSSDYSQHSSDYSQHSSDYSQQNEDQSQYTDEYVHERSVGHFKSSSIDPQARDDHTSEDALHYNDKPYQNEEGRSQHVACLPELGDDRFQYRIGQNENNQHKDEQYHSREANQPPHMPVLNIALPELPQLKIALPELPLQTRFSRQLLSGPRRFEGTTTQSNSGASRLTRGVSHGVTLTESMVRSFLLTAFRVLSGWTFDVRNWGHRRANLAIADAPNSTPQDSRFRENMDCAPSSSEVEGAKAIPLNSVQGADRSSSPSASKSGEPVTTSPKRQPKPSSLRGADHRGRFEESKQKSPSFRSTAEPSKPVAESMLYNLVVAAAFPAAPVDRVLDVLANSTAADSRCSHVQTDTSGLQRNGADGLEQHSVSRATLTDDPPPDAVLFQTLPSTNEQSAVETSRAGTVRRLFPLPFVHLLQDLWPFGEDFRDLGIGGKIYEVLKSPAGLFITLTVPVVDHNKPNDNWNKWLNVVHCVTAPLFFVLVTQLGFHNIGGVFPVWTLVLIISTIVAMVVAHTSTENRKPTYHGIFAWVGFVSSVIWIYSVAGEIVDIIQTFGAAFDVSNGILGLTLLAWGNSIGDAVSNTTMARQGFPQMAVGACIGSPLFNLLIAIGIGSIVKMASGATVEFQVYFSQVELVAAAFLMLSLSCTALVVTSFSFKLTRFYGIFLICLYAAFLVTSILAEADVFRVSITGVITDN